MCVCVLLLQFFFCTIDKMSNDVIIFSYEGGSDRKTCVRISEKAAAAASKRAHVSHEPARGCQIRMLFSFFLFLLASLAVTSLLN